MEASSIICASVPLQVKSKSPFTSSSSRNPNSVPSNRFIPTKNNKTVTLRCFHSHGRRAAAASPRYFTTKTAWDRCTSPSDKPLIQRPFLDQCTRFSCFHHGRRKRGLICKSTPRVFSDKSRFHLSKHGVDNIFEKQVRVRCAAVGPDEPHAASTAWPEGVLEQQSSDYMVDTESSEWRELQGFLGSELPSHPKLYRGQLENGLRYLILPNKVPQNRFEAHMEVHAGSIDEEDDEQGIAHMIEHVAFLGSKKREKLLRTGARSNAYTDFHHTVFHIHSPTCTQDVDDDLLPVVLDALNEIAFFPKFLASRVEKERRAILSELQMMNTIEYRVDCQLLQHLHSENKLSRRFPIGLEEQIKKWDADKIRKFHERWYFPANATLYIVGDIDNIAKTVHHIEAVFGQKHVDNETPVAPKPSAFGAMANFLVPKFTGGISVDSSHDRSPLPVDQSKVLKKERHAVRPPVEHNWSLPGRNEDPKSPQIFQHELLQNFSINMFCKIPVNKVQTYGDLRNVLMKRIFLSALHFRINSRYKSSSPPFTSIELDHSDSGREGCTVTTLTVSAEPKSWQSAIKVAAQEVRRLKEFGVTKGELARYLDALLKDSEQLSAMSDNISSVDNLDFVMESDALGHRVMDHKQSHESLIAVAGTITLEEVNFVGAQVLEYISDFGKASAPVPAAIVACVPKKVHVDGAGEIEFKISPSEITDAIEEGLKEPIEPEAEFEVPKELITSTELHDLKLQLNPSFVPVGLDLNDTKLHDRETGITQRRLSNGISINYKISKSETCGGVMRLIVGGGRAAETPEARGAVVLGVRTLSEGGRVGNFSREQVELFCVNHLINCSLESTEEFLCMEFRFTTRDNGMRAAFQLLHMVLEHSVWLDDAFDRARQLYLSYYRSIPKSLERSTAHKLMIAMLDGDERFVEPTPYSLENLTLQSVRDAVMNHLQLFNSTMVALSNPTIEQFFVKTCKPVNPLTFPPSIPLIDLSKPESKHLLVKACQDFGFFKVVNHGVPTKFINKLESEAIKFFSSPLSVKQKAGPPSPFGYGSKNIGKNGDVGWVEYLLLNPNPESDYHQLLSIFEEHPDDFQCVVDDYVAEVKKMACEILELMADELKLEPKNVLSKLLMDEQSDSVFRVNYYPPCPELQEHEINGRNLIGFGEHTDPQIISVLRSNNTSGLEISLRDGSWVSVPPDSDSFFINVGDSLQVMTNGRFKSIKHRVVANSKESRVSMIYFGGPPLNQTIAPLPSLLQTDEDSLYKEFTWFEYKTYAFNSALSHDRLGVFEKIPSKI